MFANLFTLGWLANGAEEESMTSSLPQQSATDWQSAFSVSHPYMHMSRNSVKQSLEMYYNFFIFLFF